MVLLNHGLFTFGDDSATAYRRHVDLICAETWLDRRAPVAEARPDGPSPVPALEELAELRRLLSEVAGRPMVVQRDASPAKRWRSPPDPTWRRSPRGARSRPTT
ncbi:MAG: hypothetical protein R2746_05900 [Acidimicrobiales bacterium]